MLKPICAGDNSRNFLPPSYYCYMTHTFLLLKRSHNTLSITFVTANRTTPTHNMASSPWSSRMLVTPHLENPSTLTVFRHQLPPTPTQDALDIATASQLTAATIAHLKSVSARGYRELSKRNNIAYFITSPISTLTFYCFVAFLTFHTKTVTLCTAYALGLAIFLVMVVETYNTIHTMPMSLEFTLERICTVGTYILYMTSPSGLILSSFGMASGSDLGHAYSPGADYMQNEDNAARKQQHRNERSTSKTKVKPYNDLSPEGHYELKADENKKEQQDSTMQYVSDTTSQHNTSKFQPAAYKTLTPDLNIAQEPSMQTAEIYFSPQTPQIQPGESTFQMTLRTSMHRNKRLRRTRSRMSTSVTECLSEHSYFKQRFPITIYSENETSAQKSGMSTPDGNESSTSTPESDFQADLLRMMLGSPACGKRRRRRTRITTCCSEDDSSEKNSGTSTPDSEYSTTSESNFQAELLRMMLGSPARGKRRKGRRSAPSMVDFFGFSNHESEFQTKFREALCPEGSSKRRIGAPGRRSGSEESDFQAELRGMMGLGERGSGMS